MDTPIGLLSLGFSGGYLVYVGTELKNVYIKPSCDIHHRAKNQLQEYFTGIRKNFELPIHGSGTSFQKRAWSVLCSIPYGSSISYKEQALRMGSPKAQRAVGGANGKNPLLIVVPCHRVISSSGDLGGYTAGVHRKAWLLNHESIHR
tara:strand:+ start:74 stop:514 length:441 start_codon:yes stop_codon:yes gene_type:complete